MDFVDPSTGKFIKGNGGSHDKCRRRWDLADADFLKYKYMYAFERAMQHLDKAFGFVTAPHTWISKKDEGDKVVVVERGDLVFVFNFHPVNSYTDYRVGCYVESDYKMILSSDEKIFGGYENVSTKADVTFKCDSFGVNDRPHSISVYAPSRTLTVYAPAEWVDAQSDAVPGLAVRGLGPYPEISSGMLYSQ